MVYFQFQYFIIFLSLHLVTFLKPETVNNGTLLSNNFKYSATQLFTVIGEPNVSRRCRCSEVEYCREKSFSSRKQCVSSCSHFLQYFADNVEKTVDICFNERQDDYNSEKKYDCTLFDFCTKDKKDVRDVYIPKYNLTHYHMHYHKNTTTNIFSETPQNKKNLLTYSYFKKFQHCVHSCVKNVANTCYNSDKKCSVELNEYNKQTAKQIEYCTCMSVNVHIYMKRGCTCMHEKMKIEKLGVNNIITKFFKICIMQTSQSSVVSPGGFNDNCSTSSTIGFTSNMNSSHYNTGTGGYHSSRMQNATPPSFCCDCPNTQSRCSADSCPCFAARRMCDEHCESARYRGDCLNQAICKCSCEVDPAKPAKNACSKNERCDCLRIKESCSKLCACKQICKNKEPMKKITKIKKPSGGCQCAKSKKQCVKKECPCRAMYEFCTSACKCCGDCTNGPSKFHVPKHVQNCFLEHKHESSGLIVTLIGEDYIYRGDFYHESKGEPHVEEQLVAAIYDLISKYKIELYEIVIFVSKSPCFHQDCDPKCEVVDECRSNKACAKLLGLLLSKVRKELCKVDVKMTVKFLYPHLNRGDLYTKQGILCMLQAGIKVEPLLMKDWSAIMDWAPHGDHKGEYLQLWNNHKLDKAVAQSQSFINECRRALGLSMKFWVAEIHEIVKNTILHYSEIRVKCGELNNALKQLDLTATPHKIRSTPSKRRSFIDMLELRDKLLHRHTDNKKDKSGSNVSVASEDAHAQAMVASFCGRSFDDGETNEIAQRIRRATANINVEIETLLEFLTHKGAVV